MTHPDPVSHPFDAAEASAARLAEATGVDYAVNLSGFVVQGRHDGDAALAERRVPVFWGRGTGDDTIPTVSVDRTAQWLPEHSALDARIYEGLGHGISPLELGDISSFIRAHLPR